jgi:serine/threonine-protein kinase
VAFRALSGRLPFEGQNALTLIALKLDREPPSLSSTTGDAWPGGIERWLGKIMARDREKRFENAPEALASWRKVCRQMGNAPRRRPRTLPVREERTDVTARTFTSISSVSKVGSRH